MLRNILSWDQDLPDTQQLLHPNNVDRKALCDYAREAADFSTGYQMPHLDFAVNHYGKPDIAMFDFTSMFAAENACRVVEKKGHKLLQCLVGDSLLEVMNDERADRTPSLTQNLFIFNN